MPEKKAEKEAMAERTLFSAAAVVGCIVFVAAVLALFVPAAARGLPYGIIVVLISLIPLHLNIASASRKRERLLNDAIERAEASDKTRRTIIANMTHEFRTPLNSVIGFAELLADGETDPERAEMARCVQQGGWELLDLVNALVKAAELSSTGLKQREPTTFALRELASAIGAAHAQEFKAKGLRLEASWDGDGKFAGDMDTLVSILSILISNAVKYSDEGKIELRMRELSVADGRSATVEFVVADQGRGMDEDALARLFSPFDQGETPLIKRFPGAGVGLYTAKRLTEALRGDLRLESKRGAGTTAYLIIPLETVNGTEGLKPWTN